VAIMLFAIKVVGIKLVVINFLGIRVVQHVLNVGAIYLTLQAMSSGGNLPLIFIFELPFILFIF